MVKKAILIGSMLLILVGCGNIDVPDFRVPTPTPRPTPVPSPTPLYRDRQIREDLMMNMSTSELVEAILQYPFMYEIRSYQRPQEGFDNYRFAYNGLFELMNREDRATALLNRYLNSDIEIYEEWSPDERADYVTQIEWLETILAQSEILEELTAEQQTQLLERLHEVYYLKIDHFNYYDDRGLRITTFLASRLWLVNDPEKQADYLLRVPEMDEFNKTGLIWNMDFVIQAVWGEYVSEALGLNDFSFDDLQYPEKNE